MHVKSILCAYSGARAGGSGLAHALRLAAHHDAHLTGVVRHDRPQIERQFAAQLPRAMIDLLRDADTSRVAEIEQRFAAATTDAGRSSQAEFVELDEERDGALAEFARTFDLVVTGAHSEEASDEHLSAHPDLLALQCGRPILVVPDGYSADALATNAVVAWDGKRSAARAIGDAMDILAEKAGVTLLSVGPTPRGTDRLIANMTRHDVRVVAKSAERSGSVADTILSEARALGAKLIVMGAFEHSKFSHDLFGGVTTDVIRDADVPVFMAH